MSAENETTFTEEQAGFNEHHQRHLTTSFQHIDQALAEVETIMAGGDSPSPFRKYVPDMTPVQRKVAHDHFARIRETMRIILEKLDIALPPPLCGALWALRVQLLAVGNTLEEVGARYMRGYGELSDNAAGALDRIRSELQAQITRLSSYLSEAAGGDMQERFKRLEKTTDEARLLRELDRVVTTHGLVEFRGALSMLLDRIENPTFEIGVFGRVSSGKSSLLNYFLGGEFLPVGVTPVTAIPIRITTGTQPAVIVEFAEADPRTIEPAKLAEFCSEQHNPGNVKHVTRIRVQLPVSSLQNGVTFVDTPGLGSLALAGAEETVAYLPRCDLGILLVDAASALTHEDMTVIDALYRAGATAFVLISKADLLSPADRQQAVDYTRRQLLEQTRLDLPVCAVSVRGADASLCDHWLQQSLKPVLAKHAEETGLALKRKIGGLRESVIEALQQRLRKQTRKMTEAMRAEREIMLNALRDGEAMLDAAHRELPDIGIEWQEMAASILTTAAQAIAETRASRGLPPANPVPLIITTAVPLVHKATAPLREKLENLHAKLSNCLQTAERRLDRFKNDLDGLPVPAGMPAADLSALERNVIPLVPPLLIRWNNSLLQSWIGHQLLDHMASELTEALVNYGRVLQTWTRQYVGELRQIFWSRAELGRAQLGLFPETKANDDEMEKDLRVLDQWE